MKIGFHTSVSVVMLNSHKKTATVAHHHAAPHQAVVLHAVPPAVHHAILHAVQHHVTHAAANTLHLTFGVFGLKVVYPLINRSI